MDKRDVQKTQKERVTYVTEDQFEFILRNNILGTYKVIK